MKMSDVSCEVSFAEYVSECVKNHDRLEQENAELREFAAYCQGFLGCEETRDLMALHSITLRAKELLNK